MPVKKNKPLPKSKIKKKVKKTNKNSPTIRPFNKLPSGLSLRVKDKVASRVKPQVHGGKQSRAANAQSKKEEKKVKAEIRETVKKLPGLIVEQVRFNTSQTARQPVFPYIPVSSQTINKPKTIFNSNYLVKNNQAKTSKEEIMSEYHKQKTKKNLMWMGVVVMALIIFALWTWNTYVFVGDVNQYKKQNGTIFSKAGQDMKKILTEVNGETQIEKTMKADDLRTKMEEEQKTKQKLESVKQDVKKVILNLTTNAFLNTIVSSTNSATPTVKTAPAKR